MPDNDTGFGTTPFFFVPRSTGTAPAYPPGNYYVAVRLHSAKVVFRGGWWNDVKAIAISTSATFTGGTAPSVAARNVNTALRKAGGQSGTGSGIQKLVVSSTPATMETLSLGANFTVTRRDIVNEFFQLAQKESFTATLGLSAGAVAAVKAMADVIPGLIRLFKGDAPEKEDALAVAKDIPLQSGPLRDGYLIALAAQGKNDEIPKLKSADQLRVTETGVELDGKPLKQVCYVVLEVLTFPIKEIAGSGELWVKQYNKTTKQLEDFIGGITPVSDKERVLAEALKGIYTVDALQAEDPTFTQQDKDTWRKRLTELYRKAQAVSNITPMGDTSPLALPALTAEFTALLEGERDRLNHERAYERQLEITRERMSELSRPALVIVEPGEAEDPEFGGVE